MRSFCRPCHRQTRQYRSGGSNGDRPEAAYWRCSACGNERVQLGNSDDVESMCRSVLDAHLRHTNTNRDGDYEDRLGDLVTEALTLYYESYDPTRGVPFLAYATGILRLRVTEFNRKNIGRHGRKPHADALSLHVLVESGELDGALSAGDGDPATDRNPDLSRVLVRGSRRAAERGSARVRSSEAADERQRGLDRKPDARAAARGDRDEHAAQ